MQLGLLNPSFLCFFKFTPVFYAQSDIIFEHFLSSEELYSFPQHDSAAAHSANRRVPL